MALAYSPPTHILHHPLGRPVRLVGSADSGGYHTGCRGDSVTLRSPGNTPLGRTVGLVAQPAGTTRRDTCRAYVLRPRTSCGDTNGSTLHVAKQVRGIQNPQSCRQAHRISRFPSAPFSFDTLLKQTNDHSLCPCVVDDLCLSTCSVACHSKSGGLSDRRVTSE